jgi:hypothetical protein
MKSQKLLQQHNVRLAATDGALIVSICTLICTLIADLISTPNFICIHLAAVAVLVINALLRRIARRSLLLRRQ